MRSLVALLVLAPTSAFAADYYVCERSDGTVLVTDREASVPQDCRARRTVALPSEPPAESVDAERWKAIDAMVEEARQRRRATEAGEQELEAKARPLRRHLVHVRLKVAEARARSNYLSWRWSALFPGDWIPWFADPDDQEALARQIALLETEEARTLGEIEALRKKSIDSGLSREIVMRALPLE